MSKYAYLIFKYSYALNMLYTNVLQQGYMYSMWYAYILGGIC